MDCKTARYLLEFNRPPGHDLDAADQAALDAHLAVCTDCDCIARAERQFDEHLGRAIRDVPVPQGLQDRVLTRLRRQRDQWWLEGGKRVARYAAAAAVLLLAVWGGFYWKTQQKETLQSDKLLTSVLERYDVSPPDAAEAEKFFASKGHTVSVPPEFNCRYLTAYNLAPLGGREVPHLHFVRTSAESSDVQYAEVYILTDKMFNLSDVQDLLGPGGYRFKVEVRKSSENYAYVAVYTGKLQDLFHRPEAQAE